VVIAISLKDLELLFGKLLLCLRVLNEWPARRYSVTPKYKNYLQQ